MTIDRLIEECVALADNGSEHYRKLDRVPTKAELATANLRIAKQRGNGDITVTKHRDQEVRIAVQSRRGYTVTGLTTSIDHLDRQLDPRVTRDFIRARRAQRAARGLRA